MKASNTNSEDVTRNRSYGLFGQNISLSADGNTLAVEFPLERRINNIAGILFREKTTLGSLKLVTGIFSEMNIFGVKS